MKKLVSFINESLNEAFNAKFKGVKNGQMRVSIFGNEYGYEPKEGSIDELVEEFQRRNAENPGQAVAWLKRNSILVDGSKRVVGLKAKFGKSETDIKESNEKIDNPIDQEPGQS